MSDKCKSTICAPGCSLQQRNQTAIFQCLFEAMAFVSTTGAVQ
jgi:hypothetical protein